MDDLDCVINFEIPNIAETYVHRIGRTGRAGAKGTALSFCDAEEKEYLKDIEKLISKTIEEVEEHPFPLMNHEVEKNQNNSSKEENLVLQIQNQDIKEIINPEGSLENLELRSSFST